MSTETKKISLSDLSPEEKAELIKEAQEQEKAKKLQAKENIQSYKELSELFVKNNIDIFVHRQNAIEEDVKKLFQDYESIKAIKVMVYGEKALKQESHTSTLADGSASITIGHNVTIGFDGTEKIGVEGMKEFLETFAEGDEKRKKLERIVNVLLKPNKQGMLNPSSIITLNGMRAEMNEEEFDKNLDIIINAQTKVKTTLFVSGWKFIEVDNIKRKVEFRFSV